jgi:hypothetical protein
METYERFKVESGVWLDRCFATEHVNFWNIAAYSHPRLTKRLNKANKAKLEKLMDPATPVDTYIQGVGFKTPYRYNRGGSAYDVVYVIASEPRELNPADAERETILLRRYDPATFYDGFYNSGYGRRWGSGINAWVQNSQEESVQHYMLDQWHNVQPVFLDRLKKKEKEALALLCLLDHGGYIEGVGGVYEKPRFEHNVGWVKTGERVFFIEKASKPISVE